MRISLVLLVFLLCSISAQGQNSPLSFSNIPLWSNNTRFGIQPPLPQVKHPSLTLNGFDCTSNGCGKGLGLIQTMNEWYTSPTPSSQRYTMLKMVNVRDNPYQHPNDANQNDLPRDQKRYMSARLQVLGYLSLASLVAEKNGYGTQFMALGTHQSNASQFISLLRNTNDWKLTRDDEDDDVKYAESIVSISSAIDLYLALENAYSWYGQGNDPLLLSSTEREDVFNALLDMVDEIGAEYGVFSEIAAQSEAGNRPLKKYMAMGMAALVVRSSTFDSTYSISLQTACNSWVSNALYAIFNTNGSSIRKSIWSYQSGGGNPFWAEGSFYFNFALGEVVPWMHTMRINNMLSIDPFQSARILNPLKWLAETSTPEGFNPPLDDGNKRIIYAAPLLRWDASYGNAEIGRLFSWIHERQGSDILDRFLVHSISLPRNLTPAGRQSPPSIYANIPGTQLNPSTSRQSQILRLGPDCNNLPPASTLNCHYILLNGEFGDSHTRGEGHEQSDQGQLLYYIGNNSVILDRGYDTADIFSSGTYTDFSFNNILHAINSVRGGLPSPSIYQTEGRKGIDPVSARLNDYSIFGKIRSLRISQDLTSAGSTNYNFQSIPGLLDRKILIIPMDNAERRIYLIDHQSLVVYVDNPYSYFWRTDYPVSNTYPKTHVASYNINSINTGSFWQPYSQIPTAPMIVSSASWQNDSFLRFNEVPGNLDVYMYPLNINSKICMSCHELYVKTQVPNFEIRGHEESYASLLEITNTFTQPGVNNSLTKYNYTPSFSTIIYADSIAPTYRPYLMWPNYESTRDESQGWVWPHSAGKFDVYIQRSVHSNGNALTFNIAGSGAPVPSMEFTLPTNVETGFARVGLINGVWEVEDGYSLGIQRRLCGQSFSSNTTISRSTIMCGTTSIINGASVSIGVGQYVTVDGTMNTTMGGSVSIQNGGHLHFAAGSSFNGKSIYVANGGQLTADEGVVFTLAPGATISSSGKVTFNGTAAARVEVRGSACTDPTNPSDLNSCTTAQRHNGINLTYGGANGSILKNVLVHNGYRGIQVTYVNGVTLENVEARYNFAEGIKATGSTVTVTGGNFHHNTYQGAFFDTNAIVYVRDGTYSHNGYDGMDVARSSVVTFGGSLIPANTRIDYNGQTGVSAYYSGAALVGFNDNQADDTQCDPYEPDCCYEPQCIQHSSPNYRGGFSRVNSNAANPNLPGKDASTAESGSIEIHMNDWKFYTGYEIVSRINPAAGLLSIKADCWWNGTTASVQNLYPCVGADPIRNVRGDTGEDSGSETRSETSPSSVWDRYVQARATGGFVLPAWRSLRRLMVNRPEEAEAVFRRVVEEGAHGTSNAVVLWHNLIRQRDRAASREHAERFLGADLVSLGERGHRSLVARVNAEAERGGLDLGARVVLAQSMFYGALEDGNQPMAEEMARLLMAYGNDNPRRSDYAMQIQMRFAELGLASSLSSDSRGATSTVALPELAARAFPNPARGRFTFRVSLPEDAHVRIALYDVLGREVMVTSDSDREAGVHEVAADVSSLSPGIYLYRVKAGDRTLTGTISVAR